LNWVLLKGINDSLNDARKIGDMLDPNICRLNVTSYAGDRYSKVSLEEKERFIKTIIESSIIHHGIKLNVYSFETLGDDINAACGQLVGKYSK
jgi:adenine C2-methylase RlmN of 23S rRNA A2503 and tRNA A37